MKYSIKSFSLYAGVSIFLWLVLIFGITYQLKKSSHEQHQFYIDSKNMLLCAKLIRQSSDDLTKYARLYVVSDEKRYKEIYHTILDIRNGYKPTPQNYDSIYWDLLEPLRSSRHPLGKKKKLSDLLKEQAFDKYEYKKLAEAELNSNELVNLEIEAFNAMVGLYKDKKGNYSVYGEKNQPKAIELLHSLEYLKAKEKIMLPIDEFLIHLKERTTFEINKFEETRSLYQKILVVMILLSLVNLLSIFYIVLKKILRPIDYITREIHRFKNSRELYREKDIFYDDEIGDMSNQFYEMADNINEDLKILSSKEKKIKEYLSLVDQNIITESTDLKGNITYVSEAFCFISGHTKEELLGKTHAIVKHNDTPQELYADLWQTITNNKTWTGDIKNRTKDGGYYWVNTTIYPIYEGDEKIGYTAIKTDITDKIKVQELLDTSKQNEKRILDYVDLVDKNVITSSTDINGRITYMSEAFCKISGYTREELIGKNHSILKHDDMDSEIYDDLWETITLNRTWHGEIKNKTKKGGFYWVDATIYPIFDHFGEKVGYTAIRIDITDKKRVEELLIIDALTGIYNRRYFNDSLPRAINMAKRDRKYFSFLILDIDHFKQYNDTYGHQEGDNALIQVAASLKKSLSRASDMCFRLGGEEFGVLFESLDPKEAYLFADKIRENVQDLKIEHKNNSASKYLTISIGLVTKSPSLELNSDEIYKEADDYLYKAKETGRNRVEGKEI